MLRQGVDIDKFTYDHLKRFFTEKGSFPSVDELRSAIKEAHTELYAGKVLYYYIDCEGYLQYALVSIAQDKRLKGLDQRTRVIVHESYDDYIELDWYTTTSDGSTIHRIMYDGSWDVSDVLQALTDKS